MARQNILIEKQNPVDLAKAYYRVITGINDIHITEGELILLAFSAIYGTLSSPPIKDRYIKEIGGSESTIGNILSSLRKKNLMVKVDGKTKVNPAILFDFKSEPVLMKIGLKIKE